MEVKNLDDIKIYQTASNYSKLFSKAVKEAQEENRRKGIPNVYAYQGKTFYELPNGEITTKSPFESK
jgi:hypothetical protein